MQNLVSLALGITTGYVAAAIRYDVHRARQDLDRDRARHDAEEVTIGRLSASLGRKERKGHVGPQHRRLDA